MRVRGGLASEMNMYRRMLNIDQGPISCTRVRFLTFCLDRNHDPQGCAAPSQGGQQRVLRGHPCAPGVGADRRALLLGRHQE